LFLQLAAVACRGRLARASAIPFSLRAASRNEEAPGHLLVARRKWKIHAELPGQNDGNPARVNSAYLMRVSYRTAPAVRRGYGGYALWFVAAVLAVMVSAGSGAHAGNEVSAPGERVREFNALWRERRRPQPRPVHSVSGIAIPAAYRLGQPRRRTMLSQSLLAIPATLFLAQQAERVFIRARLQPRGAPQSMGHGSALLAYGDQAGSAPEFIILAQDGFLAFFDPSQGSAVTKQAK